MPKKSKYSPESKARILRAYRDILAEAVPAHLRNCIAKPSPEIRELANAYGLSVDTLKTWDNQST